MLVRLMVCVVVVLSAACSSGDSMEPEAVSVSAVVVDPPSTTIMVGGSAQLSAFARDASGNTLAGRPITWLSGNGSVVAVSAAGLVTGLAVGAPVSVTATSEGRSGVAQVTVLAPVAGISITPPTTQVLVGASAQLTAILQDVGGNVLTGRTVTWTSSNAATAPVSSAGVVTGLVAGGPFVLTATSEGRSANAQVTVLAPVSTIVVAPPTAQVPVGGTLQLTATLMDAQGNTLLGRTVAWTSTNGNIATVSAAGLITGATSGSVTITATSEGKSGSAQLIILTPVASVSVTPAAAQLATGSTRQLTATLQDVLGNALTGRTITWTSSNSSIASVSPSGLVTAIAPGGPVTVTATSEGRAGGAEITVLAPITSVIVSGAVRVKAGDSYTYTATARTANGAIVSRPITWSLADQSFGTISSGGVLVPLRTGTITINLTIDGVVWSATTTGYDWISFGAYPTLGLALESDTRITNRFGTSAYADLIIACSSRTMVIYVDTNVFVTANGLVSYSFDNGTILSQTWIESSNFRQLIYPGSTNGASVNFANSIASSRLFGFAFTEFQSSAEAAIFRVTGLGSRLPGLISTCQLTSPVMITVVDANVAPNAVSAALQAARGRVSIPNADVGLRAVQGPSSSRAPMLYLENATPAQQQAKRGH